MKNFIEYLMRYAGLDVSKNRIGFAVTDKDGEFITHYEVIKKEKKEKIKELFEKFKPELTFIGLSFKLDGSLNENGKYTKVWSHGVRNIIGKFQIVNEVGTTRLALIINPEEETDGNVACLLIKIGLQTIK